MGNKSTQCAFYFGSFNPPTEGHFHVAASSADLLGITQVVMIPNLHGNGLGPFSADGGFTKSADMVSLHHRVAMLRSHPSVHCASSVSNVMISV